MAAPYRIVGWPYAGICAMLAFSRRVAPPPRPVARPRVVRRVAPPPAPAPMPSSAADGAQWFRRVKPYCNAVEVSNVQRDTPAPKTVDGAGYGAACFALAGRIDDPRRMIDAPDAGDRPRAAKL